MTITHEVEALALDEKVFIDGLFEYWHLSFINTILLYGMDGEEAGSWQCDDIAAAKDYLHSKGIDGDK